MGNRGMRIAVGLGLLGLVVVVLIYAPSGRPEAQSVKEDAVTEGGPRNAPQAEPYTYEMVVGEFAFGHEVREFRECTTSINEAVWVRDETGLLSSLYEQSTGSLDSYEPIFASVKMRRENAPQDGFGSRYVGTGVVTEVNYWPVEGFGCDFDWGAFDFMAFGNEPFWRVSLDGNSATLSRPENETVFEVMADRWPIRSPDGVFEMSVSAKECRDSMSGTFFGRTVKVVVGDDVLSGCGMFGTRSVDR